MRVETLAALYCPAHDAPSPLIVVADERIGDDIRAGALGCAVCGAAYAIREGEAHFSEDTGNAARHDDSLDATRTSALLALLEPRQRVLLCGQYAQEAAEISALTGCACIAVNPTDGNTESVVIDTVHYTPHSMPVRLPFASASMHAAALDAAHASWLDDIARVVRPGGRVLAPASQPIPDNCRELARDAREWVAEVRAAPGALHQLLKARA